MDYSCWKFVYGACLTMLLCTACVHFSVWLWSAHLLGHQEWCSLHEQSLRLTSMTWQSDNENAVESKSIVDPTEVCINKDGFSSCDSGHGLQVAVMPAVSLHIIVWNKRFASLCQSNYTDHLHLTLHLQRCIVKLLRTWGRNAVNEKKLVLFQWLSCIVGNIVPIWYGVSLE